MILRRVALLLFASGFCGLVYQMAWLRLLRLVFGASTAASAAVLALFMGGLGLGSWWLGPRADRSGNPLRLYALLEAGIALAACATPVLVPGARAIYLALGGEESLGLVGGTLARLLLSALVLGLPAFLMGGTLPATVRAVVRSADAGRRDVGLLYALNTLGAVLGALVTTFFAVEHLGIRKTIWVAALVNLLVAVAARSLSRGLPAAAPTPPVARHPERPEPAAGRGAPLSLVLAAAALVGFVFFLMELVWYRMLAPILGGTSYTFGLILALALLGIGAGGLVYSAGPRRARPTLLGFAVTCSLEAVALAVPLALGDRLAWLARVLLDLGAFGFTGLIVAWAAVTAIVVLPAALVAGYQFPLLVGVLGAGRGSVGREVGFAYAANTAGAIVGSIAGGFGLLPVLSATGTWRAAVGVLVALALVSALISARVSVGTGESRSGARWRPAAVAGLIALAAVPMAAATGPTGVWRHGGIGAGRYGPMPDDPNGLRASRHALNAQIVWQEDGRESSIGLIRGAGYTFFVNGKADGSALGDAGTQVMGGLVGSMLHPDPRTALVIGLGTGSTAGWLAEVPSIERVDVVELEPAILRVAAWCSPVNHDVLEHPKVDVVVGDGRELLLTSEKRWDVIFSEPSNPYRAGISSLFSQELYRAVRDHLSDDGIFLQWLQGYEVDASVVRTVYATLGSVFGSVETWRTLPGDLLLVATRKPLAHDGRRVARRAGEEPYRSALARAWGVSGPEGFYSGFVGGPELARELSGGGRGEEINTDDHPVIEFGFARNLGRKGLFDIDDLAALSRRRGTDRPAFGATESGWPSGWQAVEDARFARGAFQGHVPPAADPDDEAARRRRTLRLAYLRSDWRAIRDGWLAEGAPPVHHIDLLALGQAWAREGASATTEVARRLRAISPAEADGLLGVMADARGDHGSAVRHFEALLRRARNDPWIQPSFMTSWLATASREAKRDREPARAFFDLLSRPLAAGLVDGSRRLARLDVARSAGPAACVEAFADLEPWVPWSENALKARITCYRDHHHPLEYRARRDLARWYADRPPELGAASDADPPG